MIVTCKKCQEKYEWDNVGSHGHPYLCADCRAEEGWKKIRCKLCGKVGDFKPEGFKETKRLKCPNCGGYMVPWRMRHFDNKYQGYPKWVSQKEWIGRKFA